MPRGPRANRRNQRKALQTIPRHGQPRGHESGTAARYGHSADSTRKAAAEGIEALKEVAASLDSVVGQLIGGIQSGMGYLGAANLASLRERARYIQVSPAGQKEAAPHDVIEVKTSSSTGDKA